jgi:hypothetical protein
MQASRINPRLSAYAQVQGAFDYNRTPLGPPGTRVLVHDKPSTRETWAPHALHGYYIGPAMGHYRCFTSLSTFQKQKANGFPTLCLGFTHVLAPTATSAELAIAAARDLADALLHPSPATVLAPVSDSQIATLKQLSDIFTHTLAPLLRVATPVTPPGVCLRSQRQRYYHSSRQTLHPVNTPNQPSKFLAPMCQLQG